MPGRLGAGLPAFRAGCLIGERVPLVFKKGCNCISRRISAEKLDDYLLNIVVDKLLTQEVVSDFIGEAYRKYVEKRTNNAEQHKLLQQELTELRRRRNTLFELVESGLSGSDSRSLLERVAGYDEREQTLLIELDKLAGAPDVDAIPEIDVDSALRTLKTILLNTANEKKLRILLQSFIRKIDINPTEVVIHYNPERIINDSIGVHSTESWHAHGESNPGYRRERAMSPDPLVRSQILYPTELRVRCEVSNYSQA